MTWIYAVVFPGKILISFFCCFLMFVQKPMEAIAIDGSFDFRCERIANKTFMNYDNVFKLG